ncbi:hypothetical protein GCM10023185_31720 [Hymenobacter saemangeumensis]|uniref:PIN domain-containing protein n=1 Tax=Hymenobacter saemangeumensis TaxID=1084522 RepID=A0ABP8IM89_9BACT
MSPAVKTRQQQLIIDADIMHAASGRENDLAIRCREVLEAVRQAGHELVRTPSMKAEWDKHASRFSLSWLQGMKSRGYLRDLDESATGIAGALDNLPLPPAERTIMLKDCHLLEAALATGLRVVSKDEAAYFHFYQASLTVSLLRKIMWASPMRLADECAEWIATGAKPQTKRKIGRRPHRSHPDFN